MGRVWCMICETDYGESGEECDMRIICKDCIQEDKNLKRERLNRAIYNGMMLARGKRP